MKIEVYYTKNCPKCPTAKQICKEIAEEFNLEYSEVNIEENLIDALQKGIASAPTISINGEIISRASIPNKEELIKKIKGILNGK